MSIDAEHILEESAETPPIPRSQRGDWTWELVTEYPRQGEWTEAEYLAREFDGLVEYNDGILEFLPVPTLSHQFLVAYLYQVLVRFAGPRQLGVTAFAPLRVRVGHRRYREPDVVFARKSRVLDLNRPLEGADLVMEVVSRGDDSHERDFIEKRSDYARAGIAEYWIVDPQSETITVLTLTAGAGEYTEHGVFRPGQQATSVLLDGFAVDVTDCFTAGKGPA